MKNAWSDLKSFVTISMVLMLFEIVTANLFFNVTLDQTILVLVTNLITAVFTYYFAKSKNTDEKDEEGEE